MYVKPENRMKINAMYYRDGMSKEKIAEKMDFTLSFVERYIASVDRRIERKEITKESIVNGVKAFGVPEFREVGKEVSKADVFEKGGFIEVTLPPSPSPPEKPEAKLDLKNFKVYTEKAKGKTDLMLPVFKSLVEALEKGRLSLASIKMMQDSHIIELKEVNK